MAASTPEDPYEVQLQRASDCHKFAVLTPPYDIGAASATDSLPRRDQVSIPQTCSQKSSRQKSRGLCGRGSGEVSENRNSLW